MKFAAGFVCGTAAVLGYGSYLLVKHPEKRTPEFNKAIRDFQQAVEFAKQRKNANNN